VKVFVDTNEAALVGVNVWVEVLPEGVGVSRASKTGTRVLWAGQAAEKNQWNQEGTI
jgi:hypothetical protein